jgi:hypothetical protein
VATFSKIPNRLYVDAGALQEMRSWVEGAAKDMIIKGPRLPDSASGIRPLFINGVVKVRRPHVNHCSSSWLVVTMLQPGSVASICSRISFVLVVISFSKLLDHLAAILHSRRAGWLGI